jgi:O-antigen/teichoic acid export membrane protein
MLNAMNKKEAVRFNPKCAAGSQYRGAKAFRNSRFRFGVAASGVSKLTALFAKFFAIPIAITYCGSQTYTLYLGLVAASMFPSILLLRMGPPYIARVSRLHQADDFEGLAVAFRASLVLTGFNAILTSIFFVCLILIFPLQALVSSGDGNDVSLVLPLVVLTSTTILGGFLSTVEAFQAGLHETHVLSLRATVANVFTAVFLIFLVPVLPGLFSLIFVLQLIPFITRVGNCLLFISRHRRNVFETRFAYADVRELLPDAWGFTFVAGFCGFVGFQLPILLVTTIASGPLVSVLAIAFNVILQLISSLSLILGPAIPALANATATQDYKAVQSLRTNLLLACHAIAILVCSGCLAASLFLADQLGIESSRCASMFLSAGIFFWAMALEAVESNYLYAIGSVREVRRSYFIIAARSILNAGCLTILLSLNVQETAFWCLAILTTLISVIPLKLETYRQGRNMRSCAQLTG